MSLKTVFRKRTSNDCLRFRLSVVAVDRLLSDVAEIFLLFLEQSQLAGLKDSAENRVVTDIETRFLHFLVQSPAFLQLN